MQMEQQPAYVPSTDRIRPGQQLEADDPAVILGSSLADGVRSEGFQDANGDADFE